jgi:hypothetical protein
VVFPVSFSEVDYAFMLGELKVKVKLSLCLINETSRREDALSNQLHTPAALLPEKRARGTH